MNWERVIIQAVEAVFWFCLAVACGVSIRWWFTDGWIAHSYLAIGIGSCWMAAVAAGSAIEGMSDEDEEEE